MTISSKLSFLGTLLRKILRQPVVILALCLFMAAGIWFTRPITHPTPAPTHRWQVDAIDIQVGEHQPRLYLFGRIRSNERTTLSSTTFSEVRDVLVEEGETVHANQVLAQLDPKEPLWQVQQRKADLMEATAKYREEQARSKLIDELLEHEQTRLELSIRALEREKTLFAKGLGSQARVDDAVARQRQQQIVTENRRFEHASSADRLTQIQAAVDRIEAALSQAELDLTRTQVRAPFHGRVSTRYISRGERVVPGTPLIELYATDNLYAVVTVPNGVLDILHTALANQQDVLAQFVESSLSYWMPLKQLGGEFKRQQGGVEAWFEIPESHQVPELEQVRPLGILLPPVPNSFWVPSSAIFNGQRIYQIVNSQLKGYQVTLHGSYQEGDQDYVLVSSPEITEQVTILTTALPQAVDSLLVETNTLTQLTLSS